MAISTSRMLMLGVSGAALLSASPALAQADPAQLETRANAPAESEPGKTDEVVVTGSRIKRDSYSTLQPTALLGSDVLDNRAATTITDVLDTQPGFSTSGSSSRGLQGNNIGMSFADFLGLGSQRTLTLVDGNRFPSSNFPSSGLQVDLNSIPTALIDRIETVAVGGAPIYGADAIAGTVNIILKKRFTGLSAEVYSGLSGHGDGAKQRIQALYGLDFAGGRGNIAVNLQYDHQDAILENARKETSDQYSFQASLPGSAYNSTLIKDSHFIGLNFTGLPLTNRFIPVGVGGGIKNAAGQYLQFSPVGDGTLVPYVLGTPTGGLWYSGGDGFTLRDINTLLTRSDRYYANAFASFDINPRFRLHAEGWYSRSDVLVPRSQGVYTSTIFASGVDTDTRAYEGPLNIRLDNPYLSAQARSIIGAAISRNGTPAPVLDTNGDGAPDTPGFYLDRADTDFNNFNPIFQRTQLYRALVRAEGSFDAIGRSFDWDATYAFGRTTSAATHDFVLIDRMNQAVDTVRDASGTIVCRNPANGCAPINPFGLGTTSDAARAFITQKGTERGSLNQHLFTADVSGALVTLPGGDLAFASGVSYRREESQYLAAPLAKTGNISFPTSATDIGGSFSTKEAFTEVRIPLIGKKMGISFIDHATIEAAGRYVDSSITGGAFTWTAGGRIAPVADIEFRGNFTRSIRAPAVTELFTPTSKQLSFAQDPCDVRFLTQGGPTRAKNCAAAGLPANFRSNIVDVAQQITVQGNPSLGNEVANSWTAGAVLRPRFLPRFSAAIDYIHIKLSNAIVSLSAENVLRGCYDSATASPTCSLFTRDAGGQITSLVTGYRNAGREQFKGYTASANYYFSLGGAGSISLSADYQRTDELYLSITGTDIDYQAGEIGTSKDRGSVRATWTKGPAKLFLQGQYIGPARFDLSDTAVTRNISGVGSYKVVNTSISYDVTEQFQLQLAVDNLFDTSPPQYSIISQTFAGLAVPTYFSGLLGRYFTLTARARF